MTRFYQKFYLDIYFYVYINFSLKSTGKKIHKQNFLIDLEEHS